MNSFLNNLATLAKTVTFVEIPKYNYLNKHYNTVRFYLFVSQQWSGDKISLKIRIKIKNFATNLGIDLACSPDLP